jgi:hypothetical protein
MRSESKIERAALFLSEYDKRAVAAASAERAIAERAGAAAEKQPV